GMLKVHVLDTTHPDSILDLTHAIDVDKTLFIVSSKSGTTVETLSHFDYFWGLQPNGAHFVAITDEGSHLHRLGEERNFRRVFLNRSDIGGRYSALSYVGLVPAALIGADLDTLLEQARDMAQACRGTSATENPGAYLGAVMGAASLAGRDKLTLLLPDAMESFGAWVEQLLAESTGKLGKGIIPIVNEPSGSPDSYGADRLFIAIGDHTGLEELEEAGHPVVRLPYEGPQQLGAEFFRWEFATAIAGWRLGINPFDQPNVQSAKDATARILRDGVTEASPTDTIHELMSSIQPGDYVAILAYLPRNDSVASLLEELRLQMRRHHGVATTVGFGPRYLHSTGQLHKGGPNSGVFVLLTDDATRDVTIPDRPYTFDRLRRSQALGDLQSLLSAERRVANVHLEGDRHTALEGLVSLASLLEDRSF
ncbi:MAG TPA: glucose-6-phosphate isomerase, partial [Dehalococcoidia bacterium]|nr:glucose-6-phosphate isomerase [Dehalococcoidia bacterium]